MVNGYELCITIFGNNVSLFLFRTSSFRSNRRKEREKEKTKTTEDTLIQYHNFHSRTRLDARMWLTCRLALVKAMLGQVEGLGKIKGLCVHWHLLLIIQKACRNCLATFYMSTYHDKEVEKVLCSLSKLYPDDCAVKVGGSLDLC